MSPGRQTGAARGRLLSLGVVECGSRDVTDAGQWMPGISWSIPKLVEFYE